MCACVTTSMCACMCMHVCVNVHLSSACRLGCAAVCFNICFAIIFFVVGLVMLNNRADLLKQEGEAQVADDIVNDSRDAFIFSRLLSFFFTTFAILLAVFWWKRRGEKKREAKTGCDSLLVYHHARTSWKQEAGEMLPRAPRAW